MFKYIDCIDAGSDYCPCSLAERGECIICSQLKDKVFCDCLNWRGVCIYQEFINNSQKSKKTREFERYEIRAKKYLREDLLMLEIKVNKSMARELSNIGAFVFLKNPVDIDAYSTPISILDSNAFNGIIKVVIKIIGVKTKSLSKCENEIMVKGPYWNGIQGLKFLVEMKDKNCLVLGRGVAVVPAILAAKKIKLNRNHVYALLDKGRSQENFGKQYFKNMGCSVEDIYFCDGDGSLSMESKLIIEQLIKKFNIKVVLSAGSDEFHKMVMGYINSIDKSINFAAVNNSTMCCSEGVCGSCQVKGLHNERIKSCKQQYNPAEVFLKGDV